MVFYHVKMILFKKLATLKERINNLLSVSDYRGRIYIHNHRDSLQILCFESDWRVNICSL